MMILLPNELSEESSIEAILPVYTEHGDETKFCLTDGTERIVSYPLHSVMRRYAYIHCLDMKAMRRFSYQLTGQERNAPLGFSPSLVLARLKTREKILPTDAALGCVNVAQPIEIVEKTGRPRKNRPGKSSGGEPKEKSAPQTTLRFVSGRTIDILWSKAATLDHLAFARAVEGALVKECCRQARRLAQDPPRQKSDAP